MTWEVVIPINQELNAQYISFKSSWCYEIAIYFELVTFLLCQPHVVGIKALLCYVVLSWVVSFFVIFCFFHYYYNRLLPKGLWSFMVCSLLERYNGSVFWKHRVEASVTSYGTTSSVTWWYVTCIPMSNAIIMLCLLYVLNFMQISWKCLVGMSKDSTSFINEQHIICSICSNVKVFRIEKLIPCGHVIILMILCQRCIYYCLLTNVLRKGANCGPFVS